jgi:hypothetical protein
VSASVKVPGVCSLAREVIPKKILNVPYPPVGTPTSEVSPLCSLSWAKRVKRLPIGYRHSGEGSGGGVPLPAKGFWDNLRSINSSSMSFGKDMPVNRPKRKSPPALLPGHRITGATNKKEEPATPLGYLESAGS